MSETYELLKEIDFAFQYQINCELTPEQCKWILDWYEKWHKCQSLACKQEARIAELEWNNSELKDENAELKQRVTEMEQRINELYADNEALKEHYPHFIDYPKAGDDIPCVGES